QEHLRKQTILRFHHVEITIAREFRVHPIARLARFAVADSVWQHDKKFRRIERLIFPEQLAGEFRSNKLRATASCAVYDENGVRRFALRVSLWFSQRPIVETQLRQCFA